MDEIQEWCYVFVNVTGKSESLCLKGFYNPYDNCATAILSRSNVLDLSHIRDIQEAAADRNSFGLCDVYFEDGSHCDDAIKYTSSALLFTLIIPGCNVRVCFTNELPPSELIVRLYDDWSSYRLSKPFF